MSDKFKQLSAHFPASDVRKRPGRGGIELSWVEARVVTDRLNEVLGHDAWSFTVPEVVSSGSPSVVKGRLEIFRADGSVSVREDFGYSTGGSGEDLKEAVSDALRRVASLVGVSSYLYAHSGGSTGFQGANAGISAAPGRAPLPAPSLSALNDDQALALKAAMIFTESVGGDACSHGEAWQLKPGGISKMSGKAYGPFWAASHKTPDGWCKDKPSKSWLAANPTEPPKPRMVPEDIGEDLPF